MADTSAPSPESVALTAGSGAPADRGTATRSPGVSPRTLTLVVVGVLVGLLVGRFILLDDGPTPAAPLLAAGSTLGDEITELEQRTASTPEDVDAWRRLGVLYVQRSEATGDPAFQTLAARALDQAELLAPGDPATTTARGVLALALHDFAAALELGETAIAANDRNVAALGVVVDAQVELGRYDAAAETAQRMLDVRPALPALSRASYLRELTGDVDGAIGAMSQAAVAGAALGADRARVEALLGDLHAHHGDPVAAAAAYERALQAEPALPRALTGLARLTAIDGDVDGAIDQLITLTASTPFPGALLLLGELQSFRGGDADAAATDEIVRAVSLLQQDAGQAVDLELAFFEADNGDPSVALALAREAYERRPNLYAAAAVAWASHRAGDAAAGLPFVEEALALGTRDALLRYRMAAVLAGAGADERAATELATAFEIDPYFSWRLRGDARALAATLDVPTPAAWEGAP